MTPTVAAPEAPAGAWGAAPRIDVKQLQHPTEHSRLLLALAATTLGTAAIGFALVQYFGAGMAALVALGLLAFALVVWIPMQVYRARLLGRSVRVTADTLPEIQGVVDEVRARLDYRRRVDVHVIDDQNPSVTLTSYLGTRILILKGAFVADLVKQDRRPELVFLIGRYFGALQARHERFTVVLVLLEAVASLQVLNLFLAPYRRATAYSGDQIGRALCGDVAAALASTERLLVGGELEPRIRARGMLAQAAIVRRRRLPRFVQLFLGEPHLTNRWLNLALHARGEAPGQYAAYCASLDDRACDELDRLWPRSPHARGPRMSRRASTALAAVVTAGLLVAPALATVLPDPPAPDVPAAPPVVETPTPAPVETPVPTPETGAADGELTALLDYVPGGFRDTCFETDPGTALTAVDCTPLELDAPNTVIYSQHADVTAMADDYVTRIEDAESDEIDCPDGRATWGDEDSSGSVACLDGDGTSTIVWTDDARSIVAFTESASLGLEALFAWWSQEARPA